MAARKLDYFLSEASSPLSRLNAAAQRLNALSLLWESIAPIGLARFCRVGCLDSGVLTLYADNGAVASKLMQQLPSLLTKFQQRGGEITGIHIDVQVNLPLANPLPAKKNAISAQGIASLEKLKLDLPESNLKEALTNLLQHQSRSQHED
jgi:hypothetical protein